MVAAATNVFGVAVAGLMAAQVLLHLPAVFQSDEGSADVKKPFDTLVAIALSITPVIVYAVDYASDAYKGGYLIGKTFGYLLVAVVCYKVVKKLIGR